MGTIEREPEVIDSLDSTSTIDALSANQGKVLDERIAYTEVTGTTNSDGYIFTDISYQRPILSVLCSVSGDYAVPYIRGDSTIGFRVRNIGTDAIVPNTNMTLYIVFARKEYFTLV